MDGNESWRRELARASLRQIPTQRDTLTSPKLSNANANTSGDRFPSLPFHFHTHKQREMHMSTTSKNKNHGFIHHHSKTTNCWLAACSRLLFDSVSQSPGLVKLPCTLQSTACVGPSCFTGQPRPLGTGFFNGSMVLSVNLLLFFPWMAAWLYVSIVRAVALLSALTK